LRINNSKGQTQFAAHCRPRSCGRQRATKPTYKIRDVNIKSYKNQQRTNGTRQYRLNADTAGTKTVRCNRGVQKISYF